MDRYKAKVKKVNTIIALDLDLYNCKDEKIKSVVVKEGDLLSFLYVKDLGKVGTCAEEIIKGRVSKIYVESVRNLNPSNYSPNYTERDNRPSIRSVEGEPEKSEKRSYVPGGVVYEPHYPNRYKILVDTSSEYSSNAVWINVEHILDVQPIDYEWDTTNTSELVPKIPEMTFWEDQKILSGTKNDYIGKEYNRPHPSIK